MYQCSWVGRNAFVNQLRRPSAYLSLCITSWGILSITTGQWTSGGTNTSCLNLDSYPPFQVPLRSQNLLRHLSVNSIRRLASMQPLCLVSCWVSRKQYILLPLCSYSLDGIFLTYRSRCSFPPSKRSRYKRDEVGLRMAYFICGSSVSKIIGSLVASGIIAAMDGILGFAAWR